MANALTNYFYFVVGIFFLALSKLKYLVFGYSPKPISITHFERCTAYNINVVTKWIKQLGLYTGESLSDILRNKSVLELGPGSDLGVGLYILSKSAKEYHAIDVYNLVETTPDQFYSFFFAYLSTKENTVTSSLNDELNKAKRGKSDRLNYHWSPEFDIVKAMNGIHVDLILSNAAFEHFDDIQETIREMTAVSKSGTILIASVDLQTHSRWIRDKDPNNIYRYPNWLFSLLSFRGTPNRVRPYQYKQALERNGWFDVRIEADSTLGEFHYNSTLKYLDEQFVDETNQMDFTSIWIFATKK